MFVKMFFVFVLLAAALFCSVFLSLLLFRYIKDSEYMEKKPGGGETEDVVKQKYYGEIE